VRGCFVTGTDTGAGKTVLAAAVAAALRNRGVAAIACKPVLTGAADEPHGPESSVNGGAPEEQTWPPDDVILASATGDSPERVAALRFGDPVSPHLAAELAGRSIDPDELVERVRARAREGDAVIVEGVGGLLVPITGQGYTVRDLACELGLPVVIAARPGLGTISHTLLTLEAARSAQLDVRAVVLTPWPEQPGHMERSNLRTIAELGAVEVHTLPSAGAPTRRELARAGGRLPVESWIGPRVEHAGARSTGRRARERSSPERAGRSPARTVSDRSAV
jgi:dethiobiotin synthetase